MTSRLQLTSNSEIKGLKCRYMHSWRGHEKLNLLEGATEIQRNAVVSIEYVGLYLEFSVTVLHSYQFSCLDGLFDVEYIYGFVRLAVCKENR
jgi:hypothetical protein